jgi:hypothetical protein
VEEGQNFSQASLLSYYEEITMSNGTPISESFFREYCQMEKTFTEPMMDFLEKTYQTSACHCITKANLIAIGKQATTKVRYSCSAC